LTSSSQVTHNYPPLLSHNFFAHLFLQFFFWSYLWLAVVKVPLTHLLCPTLISKKAHISKSHCKLWLLTTEKCTLCNVLHNSPSCDTGSPFPELLLTQVGWHHRILCKCMFKILPHKSSTYIVVHINCKIFLKTMKMEKLRHGYEAWNTSAWSW
jgi:hypothetical protein